MIGIVKMAAAHDTPVSLTDSAVEARVGTSLLKDSKVTLEFGADGKAAGSAGCNRFTTAYVTYGPKLTFGPAAATRMMCARPEVMEQEQNFLKALGAVATARLEGDRLELRTSAGTLAVSLRREDRA